MTLRSRKVSPSVWKMSMQAKCVQQTYCCALSLQFSGVQKRLLNQTAWVFQFTSALMIHTMHSGLLSGISKKNEKCLSFFQIQPDSYETSLHRDLRIYISTLKIVDNFWPLAPMER